MPFRNEGEKLNFWPFPPRKRKQECDNLINNNSSEFVSETTFGRWNGKKFLTQKAIGILPVCYSSTFPKIDFYLTPHHPISHWVKKWRIAFHGKKFLKKILQKKYVFVCEIPQTHFISDDFAFLRRISGCTHPICKLWTPADGNNRNTHKKYIKWFLGISNLILRNSSVMRLNRFNMILRVSPHSAGISWESVHNGKRW